MVKKEQGQFQSTKHTSHITSLHKSSELVALMQADKCEKYALLIETEIILVPVLSLTTVIPTQLFISFHLFFITCYASVGGAPEAYGSRRVCVCVSE